MEEDIKNDKIKGDLITKISQRKIANLPTEEKESNEKSKKETEQLNALGYSNMIRERLHDSLAKAVDQIQDRKIAEMKAAIAKKVAENKAIQDVANAAAEKMRKEIAKKEAAEEAVKQAAEDKKKAKEAAKEQAAADA